LRRQHKLAAQACTYAHANPSSLNAFLDARL
jgi:hypothetical protein